MNTTLTVRDETTFRSDSPPVTFQLFLPTETITVRDLIRARVLQEVEAYNRSLPGLFRGLVQPGESERTLNGFRLPKQKSIDAEAQVKRALEAFEGNGFLVLVNDRQVDSPDDLIVIEPETSVTFLRLVQLVGG